MGLITNTLFPMGGPLKPLLLEWRNSPNTIRNNYAMPRSFR